MTRSVWSSLSRAAVLRLALCLVGEPGSVPPGLTAAALRCPCPTSWQEPSPVSQAAPTRPTPHPASPNGLLSCPCLSPEAGRGGGLSPRRAASGQSGCLLQAWGGGTGSQQSQICSGSASGLWGCSPYLVDGVSWAVLSGRPLGLCEQVQGPRGTGTTQPGPHTPSLPPPQRPCAKGHAAKQVPAWAAEGSVGTESWIGRGACWGQGAGT